jgi:hypothetical protein
MRDWLHSSFMEYITSAPSCFGSRWGRESLLKALPSVLSLWNDLRDPGHVMSCLQLWAFEMTSVTRIMLSAAFSSEPMKWPPWPGSCYWLPTVLSLYNDLLDPGHVSVLSLWNDLRDPGHLEVGDSEGGMIEVHLLSADVGWPVPQHLQTEVQNLKKYFKKLPGTPFYIFPKPARKQLLIRNEFEVHLFRKTYTICQFSPQMLGLNINSFLSN